LASEQEAAMSPFGRTHVLHTDAAGTGRYVET
jgi:hypothetical protein